MSTKPTRPAAPSSRQLLDRILFTPDLVSAVRTLPGPVLGRLIDHVGLEDAGGLISLSSTEQLKQIFDDDLWKSERPGQDESFDADRFALWLEVMLEVGEEFAARKLTELPVDLVTLALQRNILVIDADALMVDMTDTARDHTQMNKALDSRLYHEFSEFQVISRREDGWDAILSVLVALDRDNHEFLRRILQRCCAMSSEFIEENGGLYQVLTSDESLETDVAAEREDRRAAQGFVAPSAAASFLALARTVAIKDLESQGRDAVTMAYFRELSRTPKQAAAAREPAAPAATTQPMDAGTLDLVEVLRQADVLPERAGLLLEGRKDGSSPTELLAESLIGRAILELQQSAPEQHTSRMEEMAYLANVLAAGCSLDGRNFRPFEAARAVISVCNLGLEHTLDASPQRARKMTEVLAEHCADMLFRRGWRLLHELSMKAGQGLERALEPRLGAGDPALRRILEALRSALRSSKPWLARRKLQLEEHFAEGAVAALRGLLDEYPTRRGALRLPDEADEVAFFSSLEQIKSAEHWVEELISFREAARAVD